MSAVFEPRNQKFAVVTVFTPSKGKQVIHSWGPYDSRAEAVSEAGKMRRRDAKEVKLLNREAGTIQYHVGSLSKPGESVKITDSAEGDPRTWKHCQVIESGGVQCDLREGHLEAGVWHWIGQVHPGEKHPWAFYKSMRPEETA